MSNADANDTQGIPKSGSMTRPHLSPPAEARLLLAEKMQEGTRKIASSLVISDFRLLRGCWSVLLWNQKNIA
jgi:hypothetical protein